MADARANDKVEAKVDKLFHTQNVTFKCPWHRLACAMWQRYPNPHSNHVLSEDTIERRVDGNGQLRSKRVMMKSSSKMPRWAEKVFGKLSDAGIVEESLVDRHSKQFITYTRNFTSKRLLVLEEKCTYMVSPENNNWTHCIKEVWFKSNVIGVSRAIERFCAEQYKKNASKAEKGLQFVINRLYNEAWSTFTHTSHSQYKTRKTPSTSHNTM